jgi:hypothetical protein
MAINNADDGDVLVRTCEYCGTQTRYRLSELNGDEPLTCRACGAPLEGVSRRKAKKAKREFGRLIDDPVWGVYWRERRTDYVEAAGKAIAVIIVVGFLLFCLMFLISQYSCD